MDVCGTSFSTALSLSLFRSLFLSLSFSRSLTSPIPAFLCSSLYLPHLCTPPTSFFWILYIIFLSPSDFLHTHTPLLTIINHLSR